MEALPAGTEGSSPTATGEAADNSDQPGARLGKSSDSLPSWVGGADVSLSETEASSIQIEAVAAEHRELATRLSAMGRILADPYRQAIVSYPFTARIARIQAHLGDWVEPGEPLVVLQSEEVGEATSSFYRANADYELAQANYEREDQLFQNGVGARKDFTSAETQLRVSEANRDAAEKKLHVLGFTEEMIDLLNETHQVNPVITLFAPIGGKVVANNAVLGGMVDQSTEVLTILDPTHLWVEAAVYEKDIAMVGRGQHVEVVVPAYPDESFEGTITYVSDILDSETRTITVRTELSNPDLRLKPGMFANLSIEVGHNGTALSVPSEAVLEDLGWPMVFVRRNPRQFQPRLVTPGARQNGFIEIVGGLEPGEWVVTRGNFQLKSKLFEAVLESSHIH